MIKKVKEYYVEKQKWQECYKAWAETGLCDGLTEEESIALVKKLEEAAQMMLKDEPTAVDTLIIPIIVRCYRKYKYLVKNVHAAKIHVKNKIYLLHELNVHVYNNMDAEAEFCAVMAKEIYHLQI